jgi:hypothetical protein
MLRKNPKTFEHQINVDLSDVPVSINPRSKRDIMKDLGMVEREGETYIDGRIADRLRFFLVPNADGTECETYWWNGYTATHKIMAPAFSLAESSAETGFVEIVKTTWKLYDTDSNGFFYPKYLIDYISKLIT